MAACACDLPERITSQPVAVHYLEARFNQGDRIVFRIEGGTIFFVDIVTHDEIDELSSDACAPP